MAKRPDFSDNTLGELIGSLASLDHGASDSQMRIESILELVSQYLPKLSIALVVEDPTWGVIQVVATSGKVGQDLKQFLCSSPPLYFDGIRQLSLRRRFVELPSSVLPGAKARQLDGRYLCVVQPLTTYRTQRSALIGLYEGVSLNSDAPEIAALIYLEHEFVTALERRGGEELRRRLSRQTVVASRLAHDLVDMRLDLDGWITVVFDALFEIFDADRARMILRVGSLYDEVEMQRDERTLTHLTHRKPGGVGQYVIETGESVAGGYLKHGLIQPIGAKSSPRSTNKNQSVLALPLRETKGSIIGALAVLDPRPFHFNIDGLEFLTQIAELTASGVIYRHTYARAQLDSQFNVTFARALDQIADAVIVVGTQTKAIYANPAAQQLFGYSLEELKQFPTEEIVVDEERGILRSEDVAALLFRGGVLTRDFRCQRKDGSTFVGGFTISGQFDADGKLQGWIANIRDHTERVEREMSLRNEADIDPLTSTLNRRAFVHRLREGLANLDGTQYLGLIYVDLDGFKAVNDTYGHAAGDELLTLISQRISSALKEGDLLSRFGGDEFVVALLHLRSPSDAYAISQRLSQRIGGSGITVGVDQILVTASLGVSVTKSPATQPEQLIRRADQAMYREKSRGASDYRPGNDPSTKIHRDLSLAEDIQRLITSRDLSDFSVRPKEIRALADNTILGLHLRVTWDHQSRGTLAHRDFSEPARSARLSERLDLLIIDFVVRDSGVQRALQSASVPLVVDIAAESLIRPGFARALGKLFESEFRPNDISLILGVHAGAPSWMHYPKLFDAMHRLRGYGIEFALSDPEMLSRLASQPLRYPLSWVMIPFESYSDIPSTMTANILDAQVRLSNSLSAEVIVDGVSLDRLELLRESGVVGYTL